MKINIKVFALSYASVDSDSNLYLNTLGVYDSVESAEKALKDCVAEDIECGDQKENWKIVERKAEYVDFFSNEKKQYLIREL